MPLITFPVRSFRARVCPLGLLLTLSLTLSLGAGTDRKAAPNPTAASPVTVKKNAPTVEEKALDPRDPPPDMARLAPGHKAFAYSHFSLSWYTRDRLSGEPRRIGEAFDVAIILEGIDVTLDLRTTIWLPPDVWASLR